MVEEQRARLDDAMTKVFDEVDKSYIRILQGKFYKCAAVCCEDKESSAQGVQRCIETCARPLENAQNLVKSEFSHYENRLQRCIMSCNDTIRDKMGPETKESEIDKYTKEFEGCAKKCVDHHLGIVPDIMKRIKENISQARDPRVPTEEPPNTETPGALRSPCNANITGDKKEVKQFENQCVGVQ